MAACAPSETPPEPAASTSSAAGSTPGASPESQSTTPAPIASGEPAPTAEPTDAGPDSCGASKVRGRWLNALPTDDVKAEIAKTVGDRRIRYYAEGDPITMDYSEERLNVVLGKDGRIKDFRCG